MGILIAYTEVKISDNLKFVILICKYFYCLLFCSTFLLMIPIKHHCFKHEEDIDDDMWWF
jgi:hypothetical protein